MGGRPAWNWPDVLAWQQARNLVPGSPRPAPDRPVPQHLIDAGLVLTPQAEAEFDGKLRSAMIEKARVAGVKSVLGQPEAPLDDVAAAADPSIGATPCLHRKWEAVAGGAVYRCRACGVTR